MAISNAKLPLYKLPLDSYMAPTLHDSSEFLNKKFGAQVFSNNALFFDVIVLHHQCNNRSLLIFHPIDDVLVHNIIILREWEIWILTELLIFLIFY